MKKNGFTLIELLVCIVVLLVAVFSIISFVRSIGRANIDKVWTETIGYPSTLSNLTEGSIVWVTGVVEVNKKHYAFLVDMKNTPPKPAKIFVLQNTNGVESGKAYIIKETTQPITFEDNKGFWVGREKVFESFNSYDRIRECTFGLAVLRRAFFLNYEYKPLDK